MPKQKSVFATLYQQLLRWFVKQGWPWIVENVWPAIQKMIIETFVLVVENLKNTIFEWFSEQKRNQEEAARRKAEEATRKAEAAQDKAEAEKNRAIAEVWREVAEGFRRENELLRERLDSLVVKSTSEFGQDLHSLKIDDIIEEGKDHTIILKGTQTVLELPAPKD